MLSWDEQHKISKEDIEKLRKAFKNRKKSKYPIIITDKHIAHWITFKEK